MHLCALVLILAATPSPVDEAERLAAQATRLSSQQPAESVTVARKALGMTVDFEPTAFVRAGRRGEVVEDTFQAARNTYRRHRAVLYEAMGTALAASNKAEPAARYLRRALVLDPTPARALALTRVLLALRRGREALDLLQGAAAGPPSAESIPLFEQAADAAELPSAQAEIDRAGLRALPPSAIEVREGPLKLPADARLSTGGPLRFDAAPVIVYFASETCKTCSEDLETIARAVPPDTRVVVVPEGPEKDRAIRQVVQAYRHPWPIALGSVAGALSAPPGALLVVGRSGWLPVVVKPPVAPALSQVVAVLSKSQVTETVPRRAWNLRPPDRRAAAQPALLPDGLAPGEDDPPPPEFTAAVEAYRARRYADALRGFDAVAARDDGWLLSPEARLDRALALAGLGRRDEARRLLLHTGDSRFQEEVDRALEKVGSGSRTGGGGS
jgi:tetratricopeptide (TPR) repeat protein